MAEIVNLNQFRKAKARDAKRAQADENAVKFGRSKGEKQRDVLIAEKSQKDLDDHKTED